MLYPIVSPDIMDPAWLLMKLSPEKTEHFVTRRLRTIIRIVWFGAQALPPISTVLRSQVRYGDGFSG